MVDEKEVETKNQEDEEDDSEDDNEMIEVVIEEPKEKWDCESILSKLLDDW